MKLMRNVFLLLLGMTASLFGANAIPELEILPKGQNPALLKWRPRTGACQPRKGDILVVDASPKQKWGANWFEADIDLRAYRNQELVFFIRYRAKDISKPPKGWLGFKFMLVFKQDPPNGPKTHPACNRPYGSTDGWKDAVFSVKLGPKVETGTLVLGLQDTSGRVEFDLSTLRIGVDGSGSVVFRPPPRINQNYKIKYPASVLPGKTQYRGVMSPLKRLTDDDIATLAAWNVNLVRYQLIRNFAKLGTDLDLKEYNQWLDRRLDELEEDLKKCAKHGIRFVIDLHATPGGRQAYHETRCLYDKVYADAFIEVWRKIARRFKGNRNIYAYDLINEPLQTMPAPFDSWGLQRSAAEAIRAIDPDAAVCFQATNQTWDYTHISPFAMDNVIYSFHMYKPSAYTHQRLDGQSVPVVTYPGIIDGVLWNKEKLRERMKPMRDFQLRHGAKIFVGEFSAIAWAPGAEQYIKDCIELFEEYGWDYTYHAFREWVAWSVEHAGTCAKDLKPVPDTPRKQVLLKAFQKNRR